MKQSPKVIVILFIASGVLGFLLAFLLGIVGGYTPGMGLIVGLLAFCLVIVGFVLYNNLRNNRAVPLADAAARDRALIAPDGGGARLLIVREGFVGKLQGLDVLIDGAVATQLKSPRFAARDLAAGRHEIEVRAQSMKPARCVITLAAGEIAAVRIAMQIGALSVVPEPADSAFRQRLATIPMVSA